MHCPPRYWDPSLAGLFFPVTWDPGARLPRKPSGPRPWPVRRGDHRQDPDAASYLADTLRTHDAAGPVRRQAIRTYADRAGRQLHSAAWKEERLAALWAAAHWESLLAGRLSLPPGLDLQQVAWVLTDAGEVRHWTLTRPGWAEGIGRDTNGLFV